MTQDAHFALGFSHYGKTDAQFSQAIHQVFGLSEPGDGGGHWDFHEKDRKVLGKIQENLQEIQIEVLGSMGLKFVGTDNKSGSEFPIFQLPNGTQQKFAPLVLEFHQEPEFDQPYEESMVAVCLTSRYYPVLLDWEFSHGGIPPIDMAIVDQVKSLIDAKYPGFAATCQVLIPQVWY